MQELLGSGDVYQVTVKGGDAQSLAPWIKNLAWEHDRWYGELKQEPELFLAFLNQIEAHLIGMHLARPSLEEFFMQELRKRDIEFSR